MNFLKNVLITAILLGALMCCTNTYGQTKNWTGPRKVELGSRFKFNNGRCTTHSFKKTLEEDGTLLFYFSTSGGGCFPYKYVAEIFGTDGSSMDIRIWELRDGEKALWVFGSWWSHRREIHINASWDGGYRKLEEVYNKEQALEITIEAFLIGMYGE